MKTTTHVFNRWGYLPGSQRLALLTLGVLLNLAWLGAHSAKAQNIPDANFAQAIREQCPTCIDGSNNLLPGAKSLNILNVQEKNIASIEGIFGFSALNILLAGRNQITSLPPLPNNLRTLFIYTNKLTTLSNLPAGLTDLYCPDNQLHGLPMLPTGLKNLQCGNNPLGSLPSLPPSLENLQCYNNGLTSLPNLPGTLTTLFCASNKLSSLPDLPNSLKNLYCQYAGLGSLPTLPSGLENLFCTGNPLSALPTLPGNLVKLYCNETPLTSPNLPILPNSLRELRIDAEIIKCLPNIVEGLKVFDDFKNDPIPTPPVCNGTVFNRCIDLGDQCSGNTSEAKSFAIDVPSADRYYLTLTYRAKEGPYNDFSVLQLAVNGKITSREVIPKSLGDSNRAFRLSVELESGNNVITLSSDGGYICFNKLCITGTTPTSPPPPPAPVPTNCFALGEQCSGNASERKSYALTATATGEKELLLSYFAQEGPSTLQLIVNGKFTTVALPQTPYSRVYRTVSLGTFLLNSSNNSVVMASGGGYICFLELCTNGTTLPPPPPPASDFDACFILGNGCSGNVSEVVSHTFNRVSASTKTLTVIYRALERPTSLQVTVNGTRRTVILPQTPSDLSYGTMSLGTYALNAGINTLALASEGGYACFREFCTSDPNSTARLSAEEITLEAAPLTAHPNPTTGTFEASFYLAPGQRAALSVNDMLGRPIWTKALTGQGEHKEQIRLSEAASGMFILRLQRENAEPGKAAEFTKVLVVK